MTAHPSRWVIIRVMASKKQLSQIAHGWSRTEGHRGKIFVAILFDVLSAIPWVGLIFSGLGYGTLYLWFKIGGIDAGLFSGDVKKLAATAAEFVGGAVGLGIVPGITMWAFFSIIGREEEPSVEINEEGMEETQEKLANQSLKRQERVRQENQRRERSKTSAYQ